MGSRGSRTCECGRPIVFFSPSGGHTRAGEGHDLCARCYRDNRNRTRPKDVRYNKTSGRNRRPEQKKRRPLGHALIPGGNDGDGSPV